MDLPKYTFPIFLAAVVFLIFSAILPSSTGIFVIMLLLPALVLYQAFVILKDGASDEQD
ncbi:MAG: hypothetical protein R2788_07290 [Saprospiraceae bacterium]